MCFFTFVDFCEKILPLHPNSSFLQLVSSAIVTQIALTQVWQSLYEEHFIDFRMCLAQQESTEANCLLYGVHSLARVEHQRRKLASVAQVHSQCALKLCWQMHWVAIFFFFFPEDTTRQQSLSCSVRLDTAVTAQQYFPLLVSEQITSRMTSGGSPRYQNHPLHPTSHHNRQKNSIYQFLKRYNQISWSVCVFSHILKQARAENVTK